MKEELDWLVSAYGFLIPWYDEITGEQFAEKIKETYHLLIPPNKFAYELALKSNCVFSSDYNGCKYEIKKELARQ